MRTILFNYPYHIIWVTIIIIGIVGGFGSLVIKSAFDVITKKEDATKRLDSNSLRVLATMTGLPFPGDDSNLLMTLALRHLSNLELIELDAFPITSNVSWGYYLTDLGRRTLVVKLDKKELYPKDFCEMIRIWYWNGYPKYFEKKKKSYKYEHVSWDKCWEVFDHVIRNVVPGQPENDAMTIFNSYIQSKSYDAVMQDIVNPWQKGVKELNNLCYGH